MHFFAKCNMVIRSNLTFNKSGMDISIPFLFHIKDVDNYILEISLENELESYGRDIYFQNQQYEIENDFKSDLKFVDLKNFTFTDVEDNCLFIPYKNYHILKDVNCLYKLLLDELGFNEYDFQQIKLFVKEKQIALIRAFRDMCDKDLEVASGTKEPNEIFMILRCAYELNHYATVFPENEGKSISEYSYRELCVQRSYMARKCEIERLQMEESLKESKQKKS